MPGKEDVPETISYKYVAKGEKGEGAKKAQMQKAVEDQILNNKINELKRKKKKLEKLREVFILTKNRWVNIIAGVVEDTYIGVTDKYQSDSDEHEYLLKQANELYNIQVVRKATTAIKNVEWEILKCDQEISNLSAKASGGDV